MLYTLFMDQVFRANLCVLFVNKNLEILVAKRFHENGFIDWDLVKGGMQEGEDELQTLDREISEELGIDIKYKVLFKSKLIVISTWSKEFRIQTGLLRGQVRQSYWVLFEEGNLKIPNEELEEYRWVSFNEFDRLIRQKDTLNWSDFETEVLNNEFDKVKKIVS